MLVTSIFYFSHIISKYIFLWVVKTTDCMVKGQNTKMSAMIFTFGCIHIGIEVNSLEVNPARAIRVMMNITF